MNLRILSAAILFCLGVISTAHSQGTLTQILDNGPRSNRLNLVILGDGYASAEQSTFDASAMNMMNTFLAEEPFASYQSNFNVFTIFVASTESGSDHPATGVFKNTFFNSSYDSFGITRLITIPPNNFDGNWNNGEGKVFSLLSTHVPEYDIILVLVNDPEYGGSGGIIAISSIHSAAPEIVLHELGHSYGSLADEYDSFTPGFSGHEAFNSTAQTNRDLIRWRDWILPGTLIPTPEINANANQVGLFEGSTYETTGWYRPKLDCKMNHLGVKFCEICQEQFVRTQYTFLSPIESSFPASSMVELSDSSLVQFGVVPLDQSNPYWQVEWYLDDILMADSLNQSVSVSAVSLGSGSHTLLAHLSDTTELVRTDPSQLLHDERLWFVNVNQCCFGQTGNVDCDPAGAVDISDLTLLIDHLFINFPVLCCRAEANIDGDPAANVDIADLTGLIDNLFINFTRTALCK